MTETEAIAKMLPPGAVKLGKYGNGVIQILATSACDKSCFNCTQFSNLQRGKPEFMSPEHMELAVKSVVGFHGVVGLFGGNPALSPYLKEYCEIFRKYLPLHRRGIWCNNPITVEKAVLMSETFDPKVSNLNVHLDKDAYVKFKQSWPASMPFGLEQDSRHAPAGGVAMKDLLRKTCPQCEGAMLFAPCENCGGTGEIYDESKAWELISQCDINQGWSAGIGVFRGELRAWFCEIAMAQAIIHQHEPNYPDTGKDPTVKYVSRQSENGTFETYSTDYNPLGMKLYEWWELPMSAFKYQVRKHCHECSVPLRGYGELAQSKTGTEQCTKTHESIYKPKKKDRPVQVVIDLIQLGIGKISKVTDYVGNSKK